MGRIFLGPSRLEAEFLKELTALCKKHRKFITVNWEDLAIREVDPDITLEYTMRDGALLLRDAESPGLEDETLD